MPNALAVGQTVKACGTVTGLSRRGCNEQFAPTNDTWDPEYRIVSCKTDALRGPAVVDAEETETIVDALFLNYPLRPEREMSVDPENTLEFTEEEVGQATRRFRNRKALAPMASQRKS